MAWDSTKVTGDLILSADWNSMVTDQKTRSVVTSGAGAPSSAPSSVGDIYIDTTDDRIYVGADTSAASDFKRVLSQ